MDSTALLSALTSSTSSKERDPGEKQKCKVELLPSDKIDRMIVEYCKIISQNNEGIKKAFLDNLTDYLKQLSDKGSDFYKELNASVEKTIIDYLIDIFKKNNFVQYALLVELKEIIIGNLYYSIMFFKNQDIKLNLDIVFNKFKELISETANINMTRSITNWKIDSKDVGIVSSGVGPNFQKGGTHDENTQQGDIQKIKERRIKLNLLFLNWKI